MDIDGLLFGVRGETRARTADRVRTLLRAVENGRINGSQAVTVKKAGQIVHRSPSCISQWCKDGRPSAGKLPSGWVGNRMRVVLLVDLLEYYLKVRSAGAPSPSHLKDSAVAEIRQKWYDSVTGRGELFTLASLGDKYGLSESGASRLVRGERRVNAGGPIQISVNGDPQFVDSAGIPMPV